MSPIVAVRLGLATTLALTLVSPTISAAGPGLPHDIRVVREYYQQHPDERAEFGGLFLRHGSPTRLVVNVTDDPTERPYAWESDLAYPDRLRVRSVKFSYQSLKRIQWKVDRAGANDQPWVKGICLTGVDVMHNVTVLGTATGYAPRGFWDHYAGRFPRSAVDFSRECPIEGV